MRKGAPESRARHCFVFGYIQYDRLKGVTVTSAGKLDLERIQWVRGKERVRRD